MLVEIIGKRNEERLITTSLKVAETFTYFDEEERKQYTREHKSILRAIRELKCSDKFRGEHFAPSEYSNRPFLRLKRRNSFLISNLSA